MAATEGDDEAGHQLVEQIVERIYAKDEQVVAMTLRSNFHLVLGHKMNEPTDFSIGSLPGGEYLGGPDGARASSGIQTVTFLPKHLVTRFLPDIA